MPFANRRPGVADLLYVMATELEYGPELRSRISPLITGVGPGFGSLAVGLAQRALDEVLAVLPTRVGPPSFEPASADALNR